MLITNAVFERKNPAIEATECVADKVVRLSGAEFDLFSNNLMRGWDFIRDNPIDAIVDGDGRHHCLLVVGEGRRDGILVNSEGGDYARYSALLPNAGSFLAAWQYPALSALNTKLAEIADYIAGQTGERAAVDLEDINTRFDIDFSGNGTLINTVLDMLNEWPEITDCEIDNNELILCRKSEQAEDLSDPSVTLADMYAYGYSYDGMIPLGKERALELYGKGREIYLLYEDGTEGAADSPDEIKSFDGMFGVEGVAPGYEDIPGFGVFILNREHFDKGEPAGEWLALPADADTLRELFTRIGIGRPSEGAFTITAVHVPLPDLLLDHVTKYDSLDELNTLAARMRGMDELELNKLEAVLSYKSSLVGHGASAIINLLCRENFDAFDLIPANNAYELGRYYEDKIDEWPEDVTYDEYGDRMIAEEHGEFTPWGYLKFKHQELEARYTGIADDEYRIVAAALRSLHSKPRERAAEEKPSVLKRIRDAEKTPKPTRKEKAKDRKKEGER